MNRRGALVIIGAAAAGGVGWLFNNSLPAFGAELPNTGDELMKADLARVGAHTYSEEGIPMFLACVNLAPNNSMREPAPVPSALNKKVASAFHRYTGEWQRIHPLAPATDVAKIVEVLADQDFKMGRNGEGFVSTSPTFRERATAVEKLLTSNQLIRAVNFHNTSRAQAVTYEHQLARYSKFFTSVSEDDLDKYLTTGRWHKSKPGLIVSVFEGYRNGYDVFAPLLEKYGFIGWFFLITGFLNAEVKNQLTFAEGHEIEMKTREYPDGRYALTWEEVRKLSGKHVIASHARSHTQLTTLDSAVAEREIIGSQEDFEKHLGRKVRAFVSLTGPPYGESRTTDRMIEAAGYDFVFSNFSIQRLPGKEGRANSDGRT